jgi:HK97 family phage major capsid protein
MTSAQANALSRIVDSQGRYQIDPATGTASLFNRPIRITNSIGNLAASTASGPVLLSPEFAFTQRVVTGDATFLASEEARAEFGEIYYRAIFRSGFMAADPNACVGVKAAAS